MPASPDCLLGLVGITAAGSPCFPLPTGVDNSALTESSTGLYLDAVSGLRFQVVGTQNPARDLYPRLEAARANAVQQIRTALGGVFSRFYVGSGWLGRRGSGAASPAGTLASLTLNTHYQPSGGLQIRTVRLETTTTVADVPLLLDGVQVGVLASTNAAPQSFTTILVPIDGQPHVLSATLPAGVRPLDTQLYCAGCNHSSPWTPVVNGSFKSVVPATRSNGFILTAAEVCTAEQPDPLCYVANEPQYDEIARYLAQAIYFKSAELFVLDITTDASVNRYTMLEPKMLPALGARFAGEVETHLKWLKSASGLASITHPCYTCQAPSWHPTIYTTR